MRWSFKWMRTLAMGTLICALGRGIDATRTESSRTEDLPDAEPPPDVLQPKPKRIAYNTGQFGGIVIDVGPDWLELGAGWEGVTGRKKKFDHKQPKRVSAAGTAAGGDPAAKDKQTHRVNDLKVGDVVVLTVGISPAGEEWTTAIQITRRPCGRIPPQHGDPFVGTENAFHLQDQAEQDWEEKGVPIQKRYLDPNGRAPWTKPPYPPVAPQPRLGVTRTDAATPREHAQRRSHPRSSESCVREDVVTSKCQGPRGNLAALRIDSLLRARP